MASGDTLAIFDPLGYEPTATNYATIGSRNQHPTLDFDTTTQETAIWTGVMPANYAAATSWCRSSGRRPPPPRARSAGTSRSSAQRRGPGHRR
jgi:hypothetical protein